jgi:histidinol phosphatase-like PHP family hydrolase
MPAMTPCDLRSRAKQILSEQTDEAKTAEMLENAAEEIERLRRQRDDLVSFLSGISRQTENMARSYENT